MVNILPFEILVLSLSAFASAQPVQQPLRQDIHNQPPSFQQKPLTQSFTYTCYSGSPTAYPSPSNWLSFPDLWELNRPRLLAANNHNTNLIHTLHDAIRFVSAETAFDERFLLALVMQETHNGDILRHSGCRSRGFWQEARCGVLHVAGGSPLQLEAVEASLRQTLKEGVEDLGVQEGEGYWEAVGAWNSQGVVYVNDVANRVMGWEGSGRGFGECCKKKGGEEEMGLYLGGLLADL